MANNGKVVQVIGPAIDVEFAEGQQPRIYNALRITSAGFDVPQPLDVIVRIQTLAARTAPGHDHAVALLPRTDHVGGESRPARDDLDRVARCGSFVHVAVSVV